MEEVEEGWVELPIVPEVPIYSQESRKDETQSESKTSKTAGRGGPVSVLLGTRCAVVLEEVGVLVMPWRACRSALAVLKWNGGMLGEQALSYAIQYARGDTLLPTTSLGTAQGVFTRSWAKTIEGLPDGEAGLTLALARSRSGNSIKREEKNTSSFPLNRNGGRFQTNC